MADNDIYKNLKDRFADYNEPVDASCWESLVKSLDALQLKRRRMMLFYRISAVAAAAVLLVGLFVKGPGNGNTVLPDMPERIAVAGDSLIGTLPVETERDSVVPVSVQIAKSGGLLAENSGYISDSGKRTETEFMETFSGTEVAKDEYSAEEADATDAGASGESVAETSAARQREEVRNEPEETGRFWAAQDNAMHRRKSRIASFSINSGLGATASSSAASAYGISQSAPVPPGSVLPTPRPSDNADAIEQISDIKYSIPLNVGVQAQLKLTERLALGVGLNYSMLRSSYEGLLNKRYYDVDQTLHYIGVPVNLYISLMDSKNFYLYANAGGSIEKGVRASYKLTSYDGDVKRFKDDVEGVQYSINGGFGLEYKFANKFGLYLEPGVVYYFDSDVEASIRTAQPLQIEAEIGLRFHL